MIPRLKLPFLRRLAMGTALALPLLAAPYTAPGAATEAIPAKPSGEAAAPADAQTITAATGAETLEKRWGVEVLAVRRAAAGHMLDFRYRVLDAGKAAPLFVRQTKPYLIHQRTGKALGVPETAKLGPLRNSNKPQEGRVYWMFFGNPGRFVQAGDKVTVAIGDFRVADLLVE
jgi:hypothetical protein